MSVCQLRCPSCPTTTGAARPVVGAGYLRRDDFARLLRDNPRVRHVELSNFGEILLSPDLVTVLEHAHRVGVGVSADNGMNLSRASEAQLEAMVRCRMRSATVSIDGASAETYGRYRVGGDFDAVIAHVRSLNAFKRVYGSERPILTWQFVVFGHNEHELPIARRMAAELGMKFRPKLSYDDVISPLRDPAFVRRHVPDGVATRAEYQTAFGGHYTRALCQQLWNEPQINWDGKVLGCCVNYWAEFGGNAFRDGLVASLNGERITYARAMLRGRQPPRPDVPCTTCDVYLAMRAKGRWLTRREIWARGSRGFRLLRQVYERSGTRALVRRMRRLPHARG